MKHEPPAATDRPLTARQREVLLFIVERVLAGESPTLQEVADRFGFATKTGTYYHLLALESRGLIRLARPKARAIHLLGATLALVYDDTEAGRRLRAILEGAGVAEPTPTESQT